MPALSGPVGGRGEGAAAVGEAGRVISAYHGCMGTNARRRRGRNDGRQFRQLKNQIGKLCTDVRRLETENSRRYFFGLLGIFVGTLGIVATGLAWLFPLSQPRQGRDVTLSDTLHHGIRGAGEPQVVQLRTAAIAGGPMVTASLTVVPADPGEASQALM